MHAVLKTDKLQKFAFDSYSVNQRRSLWGRNKLGEVDKKGKDKNKSWKLNKMCYQKTICWCIYQEKKSNRSLKPCQPNEVISCQIYRMRNWAANMQTFFLETRTSYFMTLIKGTPHRSFKLCQPKNANYLQEENFDEEDSCVYVAHSRKGWLFVQTVSTGEGRFGANPRLRATWQKKRLGN